MAHHCLLYEVHIYHRLSLEGFSVISPNIFKLTGYNFSVSISIYTSPVWLQILGLQLTLLAQRPPLGNGEDVDSTHIIVWM